VFGEIVRAHRRRLGLTQEELAEKAGLSVRGIGKIETGRIAAPRPPTLRLLADALGLTGAEWDQLRRSAAGETTGRPVVPAQLPPDVSAFTGREEQLAALDAMAADPIEATAVVISAVSGTAGVGKTALALRWAHRVRERFPDGQLYLNLRGYDPERPMTATDALERLLGGLGTTDGQLPVEVDERAADYRSRLTGRRMLILLDNASSAEQVRPLLPGAASCVVLVTSRDSLAGLVAVHGAQRLHLDLLSPAEAYALLHRLIGRRVAERPEAAAALAERCSRLPLALRVAAELAVSRPAADLADLAGELADSQRRLDLLDAGDDPRASVACVFSWSLRHLPPETARGFALLGVHPGPDVDAYAVASLAGTDVRTARRTLDALARAHLIHPTGPGRYGMHDLLRSYAAGVAAGTADSTDPAGTADTAGLNGNDVPAAQERLFEYYLVTAAAAMDRLYPAEAGHRPRVRPAATPVPALTDGPSAQSWLDAERACLAATVAHAATHGRPEHAVRLSAVLFRYFIGGGHPADSLAVYGHARDAAARAGDAGGEGQALNGLGSLYLRLGRHEPAMEHYRQALELLRRAGDATGQTRVLNNLGVVELQRGRYRPAAGWFREALRAMHRVGDLTGEARTRNNLGLVDAALGRNGSAAGHHRQAMELFRRTGDPIGEGRALTDLGIIEQRLGRHGPAAGYHRRALDLALRAGDRDGEAWARNGLGEADQAGDRFADALAQHSAALDTATRAGARDQQARAHAGLGNALLALGDPIRAGEHYAHALALYTDLGMAEADGVRIRLATVAKPLPATPPGVATVTRSDRSTGPVTAE
jgi:tetratricopeptide (TPR) repeat protein/transcriptional regulator with XRE-family HTH domain